MTRKVRVTTYGAPTAASLVLAPPFDQLFKIAKRKLMSRPTIVCIVGSTKFKAQIQGLAQRETLMGKIVLSHGFYHHQDLVPISDEQKEMLDELMLCKVDLADEVLICDWNGYIGLSTRRAIEYAERSAIPIHYLSKEKSLE